MPTRSLPALFAVFGFVVLLCAAAPEARAGLYEEITQEQGVGWRMNLEPDPEKLGQPLEKALIRSPRKAKLIDERYDPTLMIRTLFVTTQEDELNQIDPVSGASKKDGQGKTMRVSSRAQDTSLLGHREGFVLENVEIGLGGRFNTAGFYYRAKFELVPTEKDGNRSSDYLKDAYLGWDYYSVFDIRVGRMKIPFSQANLTSTGERAVVYSPIFDILIPKRQVGLQMAFSDPWRVFTLTGGVFNSVKLATEQMKDLDQLLYVGRAEFNVANLLNAVNEHALNMELTLGGNIAWVKRNFDPSTEHRWVGADLHFHLAVVTLEAEVLLLDYYYDLGKDEDGIPIMEAQRGWGWNTDLIVHAWPGVVDAVFRAEMMDGDKTDLWFDPTFPIDAMARAKKLWYTIGLTFHPWKYARIDLNYLIRKEKEDYRFKNNVFITMFQLDI